MDCFSAPAIKLVTIFVEDVISVSRGESYDTFNNSYSVSFRVILQKFAHEDVGLILAIKAEIVYTLRYPDVLLQDNAGLSTSDGDLV